MKVDIWRRRVERAVGRVVVFWGVGMTRGRQRAGERRLRKRKDMAT